MPIVKSLSVQNGDMFYIQHQVDSFTLIDCHVNSDNVEGIVAELEIASSGKGIRRFISTHPDQDHFGGIELLPSKYVAENFYAVANKATKEDETESFKRYCEIRDSKSAYHVHKDCKRKWLNDSDDTRNGAGIHFLWPDVENPFYQSALADCNAGGSPNNVSTVFRYRTGGGASFMWLGDLETQFMEDIADSIELQKTTVVFAAHHGRKSGKIPNSWLKVLDPQIIVLGEAPERHLHFYTKYSKIQQNEAGDITFECVGNKVNMYCSEKVDLSGSINNIFFEKAGKHSSYVGSIYVETEYTL